MARRDELAELEEARTSWFAEHQEPRDLPCPQCAALLGTLFYITWAEQPLMDALADPKLGGVPTQGFYVLVSQERGALVPRQGRRSYGREDTPTAGLPPTWIGLPGEISCGDCGTLAQIPHPRFPHQARLETLQRAAGKEPRRRWRRG